MNLLAPAALGLAALAMPIIAMYILRMRRPPRVVPSTFLWEQTLRDMQANAPWQRLRPNLLLLLQLLALAALVLALARPYVLRAAAAQGDIVAVLDTSTLMSATDQPPSRFDAAKARIGTLIDGLGSSDVMSIIEIARQPRVLIAQSADRAALHAALDSAAVTYQTPDVNAALSVAAALARGGRHAAIFVYTAAGDPSVGAPAGLPAQLHVVTLGGALRDLGIVSFAASRAADGTVVALARVANLGRRPLSNTLQLDAATGDPANLVWHTQVDLRPIALAPGASAVVVRTSLPADTVAVRASLAGGDTIAADDTAWAVVPATQPRHVLLSAQGDSTPFLQLALSAAPGVSVQSVTPGAYAAARARCADAVVFDGWLPPRLPATSVLAVAPPTDARSPLGFSVGRAVSAGGAQVDSDPYALLRYVSLREVGFSQVTPLGVPPWAYAVLRGNGQPIIVAGQNPASARREAALGFYVFNTNWALLPGFPILAQNLLDWLAPPSSALAATYRPGDAVPLNVAPCASALTVTAPDHSNIRLTPPFTALPYAQTARPGLYSVDERTPLGARHLLFAVNILPQPQAGAQGGAGNGAGGPTRVGKAEVPVELAPLVAALALLVLAGEWWVAARRR